MQMGDIRHYVDDRLEDGVFRVSSELFTDPELFELEMKHIFERTWMFLAHESQFSQFR